MNDKSNPIHLQRVTKEPLSLKEFLKVSQRDNNNISYTEIIPPKLGKKGFGKITVHYKNPAYK